MWNVSAKQHGKRQNEKSEFTFFSDFMQAATKILLEVNTTPTQLLCICLLLSCPAVNSRNSLTPSAMPTGVYSKPTNVDSKGELI